MGASLFRSSASGAGAPTARGRKCTGPSILVDRFSSDLALRKLVRSKVARLRTSAGLCCAIYSSDDFERVLGRETRSCWR